MNSVEGKGTAQEDIYEHFSFGLAPTTWNISHLGVNHERGYNSKG